jgi:hypothetical protein
MYIYISYIHEKLLSPRKTYIYLARYVILSLAHVCLKIEKEGRFPSILYLSSGYTIISRKYVMNIMITLRSGRVSGRPSRQPGDQPPTK